MPYDADNQVLSISSCYLLNYLIIDSLTNLAPKSLVTTVTTLTYTETPDFECNWESRHSGSPIQHRPHQTEHHNHLH